MYTLEELRKLDKKKLLGEIRTVEKSVFKDKFEITTGTGKSSHKIQIQKNYIAQMKTIINENNPKS